MKRVVVVMRIFCTIVGTILMVIVRALAAV
jgi:hypothetical protein